MLWEEHTPESTQRAVCMALGDCLLSEGVSRRAWVQYIMLYYIRVRHAPCSRYPSDAIRLFLM